MQRNKHSDKFVAEHQREIASHFEDLAAREDVEKITAKLARDRAAASHRAKTWRDAARIVRDTVLPPRHPDFDWIPEDGSTGPTAPPKTDDAA